MAAKGTDKDIGPDRVIDPAFAILLFAFQMQLGIRVDFPGVCGLIHPAALGLHFVENAACLAFKCPDIHFFVVIVGDKSGDGREIRENGLAVEQLRR
ncbi:MAG TPA: hypothetical protein PKN04_17090, partial [bacterium]|nr:hypothetical protein [bacterium]